MGIVFRQSIKATIVTLTGAVLGAVVWLVSTMVLPKQQLGLVTNITLAGAIIQLFVIVGTANLILVYLQRYKYEDERRKTLLTLGVLTSLVGTILFSILFYIFKQPIIDLYNPEDQVLIRKYYYLLPVLVLFWGLTTIFDQYLISHVKISIPAFTREVVLRTTNLVLLWLVFLKVIDFQQYIIGNVCMYSIPLIVLVFVSSKTRGFGFSFNFKIFSRGEYKDMAYFSWYHLLVGASLTILNFIDTLMLGPLDSNGIQSAAVYGVATFISSVTYMPYRAMASSSTPILNQAYIDKDFVKIRDLFSRAGVNIFIAAIAMFLLVGLNLDNAVALLPDGYEAIKPLVLILMLGKVFDMATGLNNELISISSHYKFNFRVSVFLLVLVFSLDRVFIPIYGVYGAAWVSALSLFVFNIIKVIFLYRKMKLLPFTAKTWRVVLAGIIAALSGYMLPYIYNPYVDTIVRSIVILGTYSITLLWLKPSADLVDFLQNIKKTKRLF